MAGMAAKRKVRKDFNPKQPISVDVSNCTEEEKKEVQQAFFDVGVKWTKSGTDFIHLSAKSYSNSTGYGSCYDHLMYGIPRRGSISPQQFLSMVYEPEQQGHVHADLMALYAKDAKTTNRPWELWEYKNTTGDWVTSTSNPLWNACTEYRRKPKTHTVNGVEIPDLRIKPKEGEEYWFPDAGNKKLVYGTTYWVTDASYKHRVSNNLCYEPTEEGKQAAILHAKAMLGIA